MSKQEVPNTFDTITNYSYPNTLLNIFAKAISYIFHPLFIPTYFFYFLVHQFPYEFEGISMWQLQLRTFSVFWMTAFFPAFAVFLLWKLKLGSSIFLRTQKDRVIPYFITMFFYWWMYYLSRNFPDQPIVLRFFYFGIFITTCLGVFINNYFKISLHGIAMGGLTTALILTSIYYHQQMGQAIAIGVLLTGLVCVSRFLVSNHTEKEVYVGLFVGCICQCLGYWFVF